MQQHKWNIDISTSYTSSISIFIGYRKFSVRPNFCIAQTFSIYSLTNDNSIVIADIVRIGNNVGIIVGVVLVVEKVVVIAVVKNIFQIGYIDLRIGKIVGIGYNIGVKLTVVKTIVIAIVVGIGDEVRLKIAKIVSIAIKRNIAIYFCVEIVVLIGSIENIGDVRRIKIAVVVIVIVGAEINIGNDFAKLVVVIIGVVGNLFLIECFQHFVEKSNVFIRYVVEIGNCFGKIIAKCIFVQNIANDIG